MAEIETKDERTITVPVPTDATDIEQLGKFLVNAGQDGYNLQVATLITEARGTQFDPYSVTKGVKLTVTK